MCAVMCRHDSHFLLLLDLLLFLLVVLHYLEPLSLDQTALLDVELLLRLQEEAQFTEMRQTPARYRSLLHSDLYCPLIYTPTCSTVVIKKKM